MTVQARKQRERAIGVLLAQASELEREAAAAKSTAVDLRLRGRALQLRGSAWVIEAELMEAD